MRTETRLAFNGYLQQQERLNGVPSARESFSVIPSVQQTLETRIQESSAFLKLINMIGVRELKGEKLGLGIGGPIAGRTNTTTTDRATRDLSTIDGRGYECRKTDFDTHVTYAMLDAWAKFPDFQARIRDLVVQRQALDRMMIGFNGTSSAATTDRVANPLLQDVNMGWLQNIRAEAPTHVMDHGAVAGKVTVGPDGDYRNLDALVYDAAKSLISPWYREDTALVAVVGRDLMHDKLFPLVNEVDDPTEIMAADVIRSQRRLGGLQGVVVPYFPANKVLITRLDNLSLYWQESARRRTIVDNAKRDRIENYESSNDAYVVEDYDMVALVENIEIQA